MLIPDLGGLGKSRELENQTDIDTTQSATELSRRLRVYGRRMEPATASTNVPDGTPDDTAWSDSLQERDSSSCQNGRAYYSCSNGFIGCCSANPCSNANAVCVDDAATTSDKTSTKDATSTATKEATGTSTKATATGTKTVTGTSNMKATKTSTKKTNTASKTETSTQSSNATSTSQDVTSSSTSVMVTATGSPTGTYSTSTIASATVLATPAPSCPSGNGTTYIDSTSIAYDIHCDADNSYESYNAIVVDTGGYSQCFSACSYTGVCAGFTFVGLDNGSCYLKTDVPTDGYISMNGSNYITAEKVNSTAAAAMMSASASSTATATPGKTNHVGAIVGGTVGGVTFIALIGLGVALLARYRRKKIEEKHGTITTFMTPPLQHYSDSYVPASATFSGHSRTGSTAHDAYVPTGGNPRGTQTDSYTQDGTSETFVPDRPPPSIPPGVRAEGGGGDTLPASVFRRQNNRSLEVIPIAADAEITRSGSGGSRRSLFVEHLDHAGDSSNRPPPAQASPKWSPRTTDSESPVLGRTGFETQSSLSDEVRRRRHLLSYASSDVDGVESDGGRESGRTTAESSPVDSSMMPSPLGGSGRWKNGD
ncbi:hypothetical protein EJ03DRAFT_386395 [Teratosphaeria nubilosa]|uniref:Apple domain-containing protein n=1 Tax=Teratosphaeria nubilosa TaxID=161662 RepID=A0A6G1KTZ4_9PEZI|nr:hypothetical protein EJ03DRAFT_386395 [Teratosphaeria nubilosa]